MFLVAIRSNLMLLFGKFRLEYVMDKIDRLSQKVKELQEQQHKHELRNQKVYKTKFGKWLDRSAETYFTNKFKKTKDPWRVEMASSFIGFGCFLITSAIVLMFSAGLALMVQALGVMVACKVCSAFKHARHVWNCSLVWGDSTYYGDMGGKIKFESIVSKDVFDAALWELELKEPTAHDLVQQLRENPLSPHNSHVIMDYLNHYWNINELELLRKGAVTPTLVSTVTVETPDVQNTEIVQLVRTLRL